MFQSNYLHWVLYIHCNSVNCLTLQCNNCSAYPPQTELANSAVLKSQCCSCEAAKGHQHFSLLPLMSELPLSRAPRISLRIRPGYQEGSSRAENPFPSRGLKIPLSNPITDERRVILPWNIHILKPFKKGAQKKNNTLYVVSMGLSPC